MPLSTSLLTFGDPNVMLGVMKVLRIMLLRNKLFLLSPAPIHPMLEGGDPNAMLVAIIVLEVNAGVRLFSGGRSYLTLRLSLR